jgi:hypothetical protein
VRRIALLLVFLVPVGSAGCTDRALGANDETGDPPDNRVERPKDGQWSPCEEQPDCSGVEFCVFPMDEAGFCTDACGGAGPDGCPPAYAGSIESSCVGIGGGNEVCALECDDGARCPVGMVCERVELPDGPHALCF